MASRLCDSCKSTMATLFCRADTSFLCVNCDTKIHAVNKLASRHARVLVCEVCVQAPAHVTCKADAAALCVTCDRDIHSANLLASRHERVPITPLYDSMNSAVKYNGVVNFFDDVEGGDVSREEAEAASWLLPNPKVVEDMDPFLGLDCGPVDSKLESQEQNSSVTDGVVPVQSKKAHDHCFDSEISGSKSFGYGFNTQCLSHNVLSSSLDVGVVPDGSTTPESTNQPVQLSSAEREARVLRYREKRKNRKFEKTIRYASRKAYAETRPRIKGRFAKRTDIVVDSCSNNGSSGSMNGFGVVPSY